MMKDEERQKDKNFNKEQQNANTQFSTGVKKMHAKYIQRALD